MFFKIFLHDDICLLLNQDQMLDTNFDETWLEEPLAHAS